MACCHQRALPYLSHFLLHATTEALKVPKEKYSNSLKTLEVFNEQQNNREI